jgi:amino acid adenylation domain-containing protein
MLHTHLERAADHWPDRVAVVANATELTYRELDDAANRLARALVAAGVEPGDRVAIFLDNRSETVVAIYAVLKAGAAFMMVNPTTKSQKLVHLLEHAGARAIVLPAAALERARDDLAALEHLRVAVTLDGGPVQIGERLAALSWRDVHESYPADRLESRGIDLDLAALLYTSGSTGEAKGVMLTHLNITSATESIATYLELTASDVIFTVLPLSFGYGLTQLFPAIMVGARVILEKGMVFPHATLTRMATSGATGFAMVPTGASVLLGLDLSKYDLTRLRYITNAGAGLPPDLTRRVRRALPHVRLFLMYGQTECLRASYLEPDQVDRRPDSVGRGIPNQELLIVDEAGTPVGADTVGELVVRGPHVMAGYWRCPEETARKLRPGRYPGERVLFTSDLFRRDSDGYYYFVARQDDIIKSRGEKVSPREVENVLYALPGVVEAAVVGVPDPLLGQAVKAFVVLAPGASLEPRDVLRHCATHLEDYMVPAAVEFRQELPKNERGKIVKRELTAALWE